MRFDDLARDDDPSREHERLVADCPLPLFMTDLGGTLVLANLAFASFVNLSLDQITGMALADTRLGRLCPEILDDLRAAIASLKPTQRMLSFPWRSQRQVSMMIWLVPELVDRQPQGVIGAVHPFATTPLRPK